MYRFRISKYRNTVAKIPKKEAWITDINVSSGLTHGNLIHSSASFIAFHQEKPGGGSLEIVPLDYKGKFNKNTSSLQCHSDLVTDFVFSPFDDGLLATASQDCTIKLWRIPENGLENYILNPEVILSEDQYRIETVVFHPTVDELLLSSSYNTVKLWDLNTQQNVYCFNEHDDLVQSICWHGNGSLFGTSSKDKKLRIVDPRSKTPAQEASSHSNPKDSRIIWLGDTDQILSTGFQSGHERQALLRDVRSFSNPMKTVTFDNCIGILLPFFDCDTNMLFIAGKADASITFLELTSTDPYLTVASKELTEGQTKGMCAVPKRAMNVMQGEVNRLLQLTQSTIVPISYQVPRKTYRDFHSDLFPNTRGTEPAITKDDWFAGENNQPGKVSLDPSKRKTATLQKHMSGSRIVSTNENEEKFESTQPIKPPLEESKIPPVFEQSFEEPKPKQDPDIIDDNVDGEFVDSNFDEKEKKQHRPISKPIVLPKPTVSPLLKRGKSMDTPLSGVISLPKEPEPTHGRRKGSFGSSQRIGERFFSSSAPIAVPRVSMNGSERRSVSSERRSSGDRGSFGNGSPKASWVRDMIAVANANNSGSGDGLMTCGSSPKNSSFPSTTPPVEVGVNQNTVNRKEGATPVKPFAGFRVSKFRHLKGTPFHKNQHIENLKNLSTSLPRECDGIHGNKDRVVLPLKGPGGRLIVVELRKCGRLPDGVMPVLQNVANVMDFCWDPFNNRRLAVGCDDATIRLWVIPEQGLVESQETPTAILKGHTEKVTIVKFHPLAEDILVSCSNDLSVRIWDVVSREERFVLSGHSDQIFNLDWSPNGKHFATASKDGRIRVYNPRMDERPVIEGVGSLGNRGARIVWVLQGKFVVSAGFDRVSERQIKMFSIDDLNNPVTTVGLDVSPAILIPHYDEDSSTLFLTGKGDTTIFAYEVIDESPFLFPLSHHKCSTVHQGLTFLPKYVCDVKNVEFARALRLTNTTIEPISFTVPRVKMDVFQSDLFPDTRVLWEKTITKDEWFQGLDKQAKRMSLQPTGMEGIGKPKSAICSRNLVQPSPTPAEEKSAKQKEEDLMQSMSRKLSVNHCLLEQDSMEGVDPSEWD